MMHGEIKHDNKVILKMKKNQYENSGKYNAMRSLRSLTAAYYSTEKALNKDIKIRSEIVNRQSSEGFHSAHLPSNNPQGAERSRQTLE